MDSRLSALPQGSRTHYNANGFAERVPSAQLEAVKACCKKNAVTFDESVVN
jgi:hypothetical protein